MPKRSDSEAGSADDPTRGSRPAAGAPVPVGAPKAPTGVTDPWSADDSDWLHADDDDATGYLEPPTREPSPPVVTPPRPTTAAGPKGTPTGATAAAPQPAHTPTPTRGSTANAASNAASNANRSPDPAPSHPAPPAAVFDHAGSDATTDVAAATQKPTRRQRSAARRARKAAERRAWKRRPLWRGRVLPRSVLGISLLMLAAGLGAASAGTALFMNYQYRRDLSDERVKTFDKRAKVAVDSVKAEGINARARIQDEIEPIRKLAATGDTLRDLLAKTQASVWQVSTSDPDGGVSVGSAFVVASDAVKSFLLTSFEVVRAGTAKPGPSITLRKGADTIDAQLWTWDEQHDLALLIVERPSMPRLDWAISTDTRLGQQMFAVSGFGTAGGAITQGFIAEVDADAIQHSAPIGTHFRGGPVITDRGAVLAVASRAYAPFGFRSDGVWFAPPVRTACKITLRCPAAETSGTGQVTGAGAAQ